MGLWKTMWKTYPQHIHSMWKTLHTKNPPCGVAGGRLDELSILDGIVMENN